MVWRHAFESFTRKNSKPLRKTELVPTFGLHGPLLRSANSLNKLLGFILNITALGDKKSILLGFSLIALLASLLFGAMLAGLESGPIKVGLGSVLGGLYIMAWGIMFLLSFYFEEKTFFFRALIWVCENWSFPSGRFMAFFYFLLATTLGAICVLQGLGVFQFM